MVITLIFITEVTPSHKIVINSDNAAILMCQIKGLNNDAVTVVWKNSAGTELKSEPGYTVDTGSVDNNGIQESKLKIAPDKLSTLPDVTSTYSCIVKSGEYPADSPEVTKTVKLTKLGMCSDIIKY